MDGWCHRSVTMTIEFIAFGALLPRLPVRWVCNKKRMQSVAIIDDEESETVPPHIWRVHGRDYDLSSFVDDHPGGALMLLLGRGRDCTMFFEQYHVFNEPRKRLATYDVTPDGLRPPVPECPSPFLVDVHAEVKAYFATHAKAVHGRRRGKASWLQLVLMMLVLAMEVAAAYYWLAHDSVWAGVLAGFAGTLCMENMGHDACHGALTRFPAVNTLAHFIGSVPWVSGQLSWLLQHVISHHCHTNEPGKDVDAHHFPFVRWHWGIVHEIAGGPIGAGLRNVFWHIFTCLISTIGMTLVHPLKFVFQPVLQIHCRSSGLGDAYKGGIGSATLPRHGSAFPPHKFESPFEKHAGTLALGGVPLRQPAVFAGNVFIWLLSAAALIAPVVKAALVGGDLAFGVLLAVVPFFSSSLYFMGTTQISHIQEDCQSSATFAHTCPYKRQACSSMDYWTNSRLTSFFTGALNMQSIHHVLPSISLVHYIHLYPAFYRICERHGCAPHTASSPLSALAQNFAYVYRLGHGVRQYGAAPEIKPAPELP